jgi:hypothetical protein
MDVGYCVILMQVKCLSFPMDLICIKESIKADFEDPIDSFKSTNFFSLLKRRYNLGIVAVVNAALVKENKNISSYSS